MSDAEILGLINEERRTTISDLVQRASPSFWRTYYDFTVATGTDLYRLPVRALMQGVETMFLRDPNGYEEQVVELEPEERWKYARGGRDSSWPGRFAAIMEAEQIRLVPTPSSAENGYTLRVYYQRSMSEMVKLSRAYGIAARVDASRLTIDTTLIGSDGASIGLTTNGSLCDIVRGNGMFGPIQTDIPAKSFVSPTWDCDAGTTLSTDISTFVKGGRRDYLCLAGETVYPEFPQDVWPVLISAAAVQVLLAQKDFSQAEKERQVLEHRIGSCRFLMEPRNKEPDVIINRDSTLRRGWYR